MIYGGGIGAGQYMDAWELLLGLGVISGEGGGVGGCGLDRGAMVDE